MKPKAKGGIFPKFLILIVITVVLLSVFKDFLIKSAVTSIGSSVIGAPLTIDGLGLGIMSQKVRITNLKLYNPSGFPQEEPLIDIPEISVDADIPALLKGQLHVPYIVVNVKQMTIIKNKNGKMNVDSLKVVEEQKAAMQKGKPKDSKPKPKDMPIAIDYMRLNVGEVIYKDLQKNPPAVNAYPVNINNKEFKNITSVAQLTTLIMVEAMGPTGLKSAGLYAASTFLGVAFLPAGVAGVLLGNDDSVADYSSGTPLVYDALVEVIQASNGKIKSQDRTNGTIKASVQGCDVSAKIEGVGGRSKLTISARQFLVPKPEVAAGLQHQVGEKVK
jgi:hypothetical protein